MIKIYEPKIKRTKKGQTFIEYTLLLGIVVAVITALNPLVRRGAQAMVKLVADQIGNQKEAEQEGGKAGYLIQQYAVGRIDTAKRVYERAGVTNYIWSGGGTDMITATDTNLGFSKR